MQLRSITIIVSLLQFYVLCINCKCILYITGIQPRFLILDDGWQGTNVDDKMNGQQWGGRLTSFYANFKLVLSFVILYYAVYIVIHYYTILCYLIDYYHVYVCHNIYILYVST